MKKIENKYNPKDFEDKLYKKWEKNGYFKPSMKKGPKPYSIIMPPPNVTGKLHIGHALDVAIQDALIRTKRMQGYNTLWLPGMDHASIATEAKVVAKMKDEGLTKKDVGREGFLKRAWDWTREYGDTIQKQQRKLGASCDWSRSRFTLDEKASKAVATEFVNLYNDGLIYKGKKMINWCPNCKTTISDAEVEYKEVPSHLWNLRYKIVGEDGYVIVATTRPETMLGDTAVAVNPKDERYKDLVGKKVIVPIVNREIPVIADDFVDMEFGTGCVKITPAHDVNDYEAGLKHNLDIIEVFDENGIMENLAPKYKGMNIIEARNEIVADLQKLGNLVSIEDYTHNVGTCYRCHGTIEPRISEQWFVAMKDLAKKAIEEVKTKDIKIVPEKYEKTYFNWLENIHDWCISRQLWWGHRIPAYTCKNCGNLEVSISYPQKCSKCGKDEFTQDEDTLDTWFSSALWPFSTLGWPEKTEDFETFYPTSCLVTGYDIIFFWVIRMVVSGLYATGKKPFSDVVIHGLVRDNLGRKMSKSLGNGVDPLEVVDKKGADSLRFSLILGTTMGNDIKYMEEKLDQSSNFANKIWNAARFVTMNLSSEEKILEISQDKDLVNKLKPEDKWMISKLNKLVKQITKNIDKYELGVAADTLYSFIWNEFCDWYIEMTKTRLNNEEEKDIASYCLVYVLKTLMKLLHPFMPFITSEIYDYLKFENEEDLMISAWPKYDKKLDFKEDEEYIENLKQIIIKIRNLRTEMKILPRKKVSLIVESSKYKDKLEQDEEIILKLGYGEKLEITEKYENKDEKNIIKLLEKDICVYMKLNDLIDLDEERKRQETEKEKYEREIERSTKILSNKGFLAKAPKEKVEQEKEKFENYKKSLQDVQNKLEELL